MRVVSLVLAPLFLFASEGGEKCPMGGVATISPRRQEAAYHLASTTAELVAPSIPSTASGRRHSVVGPANPATKSRSGASG